MAVSTYAPRLAIHDSGVLDSPRHSALVRVTHWIHTVSFLALVVSGVAILLAHPRLYWGETGAVGTPSLIDLPLPFLLVGQSGWGRYLHFLAAWVCVLNGILYVLSGLVTQHFRKDMLPSKTDLAWANIGCVLSNHLRFRRPGEEEFRSYMSPAITSVFPALVTSFGGQQSARTIHFFVASFLVVFLFVHIAMVSLTGFKTRMRGMIVGRAAAGKESS
jgi:thiosulfate reductase cytochrome b subunit